MKGVSQAVKVGILTAVVLVLGYVSFKSVSERASGAGGYGVWAKFRDATLLSGKSRVVIAGLTVGEISGLRLDGKLARVDLKIRRGTQIWSNASIAKKASSLLGEFYLEIDPGTPESPDGRGGVVANHLLEDGDEIPTVVEATTVGDIMEDVGKIIPHVDQVLLEVRDLAADARKVVNGPIMRTADNLDKLIAEESKRIDSILERVDQIAGDVRDITGKNKDEIDRILRSVERSALSLEDLLATAKAEVQQTGDSLQERIARVDKSIDELESTLGSTASIAGKIDGNEGTLGRLVNDPVIAENIEQVTEDVKGFTQGLFGLQTVVGLRAEYNVLAAVSREYVSVEIYTRPDKFYLVELVADPRGDFSNTLEVNGTGVATRVTTIDEYGIRFSLMYGKKFDWLTLRIGIKDSTGGFGIDADLFDGRGQLTLDVYDFNFDALPRVKLWGAYNFYKYLYILGGVDDVLNEHKEYTIIGDNLSGGADTTFHSGRDFYFGAMIRFTDDDLRSLLFVGGSALAGAL